MVWLGCIDVVPVARTTKLGAQDVPDASASTMPWGEYAATLNVPQSPDGGLLIVDTLDDELEGGPSLSSRDQAGARLSFREALTIAANGGGPHSVLFDPEVFPVDGTQVVLLRRDLSFPQASQVCIDGRGRGVTFAWKPSGTDPLVTDVWDLLDGSLQVGITLRDVPWTPNIFGQMAGCRLIGGTGIRLFGRASFGPGNVLGPSGPEVIVQSDSLFTTIDGNFFGYDPTSGRAMPYALGINSIGLTKMTHNVVLSSASFSRFGSGSTIAHNHFGVIPESLPQTSGEMPQLDWGPYSLAKGARLGRATPFEDSRRL